MSILKVPLCVADIGGVGASVHFDPPAHLLQYYYRERYPDVSLPVTEKLARSILTLPLYPGMTVDQRGLVAEALREELTRLQPVKT